MEPILYARNLNLHYGDFHALKNINIDIPEKKITAFIGPSGCGKSTFLKTMNRMQDLVPGVKIKGDLFFRGQDVNSKDVDVTELRRQIGMVWQKPNLFPMSIYDNITYGPKLHGNHSKAELDEIVERSLRGAALWDELKDRLKKSALGLSGGQQQRLCIARSLAVEPEVLLMDEPTSALDPASTMRIEELMSELKKAIPWSLSPTICSRPPVSATSARFSWWANWWSARLHNRFSPCLRTSARKTISTGRFG